MARLKRQDIYFSVSLRLFFSCVCVAVSFAIYKCTRGAEIVSPFKAQNVQFFFSMNYCRFCNIMKKMKVFSENDTITK